MKGEETDDELHWSGGGGGGCGPLALNSGRRRRKKTVVGVDVCLVDSIRLVCRVCLKDSHDFATVHNNYCHGRAKSWECAGGRATLLYQHVGVVHVKMCPREHVKTGGPTD